MKLTEDVYLVGGGDTGFNISNRMDCHVFVIRGEDELALVDAGFDGPGKILSNIENDGLDPGQIRRSSTGSRVKSRRKWRTGTGSRWEV